MNDEIKEIKGISEVLQISMTNNMPLSVNEKRQIFDLIINLQQENERLKEANVYCNRTDCVGRIKNSRKYDSVYQEKEDYKSRCKKAYKIVESYELGKYDYSIPLGGIIELKDCLKGCKDNE